MKLQKNLLNTAMLATNDPRNLVSEMSDLRLDDGRPLCPQHADSLKHVDEAFVSHSLEHNTQSDEDTGPANAHTATQEYIEGE